MPSHHFILSPVVAAIAVALSVAAPVQSADAPADAAQTHGQPTARSALSPLADCLTRPYWRGTRKEWQAMLSMTSEAAGRDRFDAQARDELLSALARNVETSSRKASTRVVIVESISGGISPRYTRHGAFVVNGADAADGDMLANAGFHRIDDKAWPAIAEPLAELLKLGGCNNGADIAYDGHDATIISWFDGRRWHTDIGGPWARHLLEEFGDVGQDLIRVLVRPYWKATEAEWRRLLVNASYDRADVREPYRNFDPGERDKWMTGIASAVAASPQRSSLRIVIVENLRGSQGTFARYNRHAMHATVKDAARPIPQLTDAAFRALDADQWTAVEKPLADLMRIGGGNPGTDMIFDAYDATVISHFDGQNWRVETWFFLAWPRTADNEEAVEHGQLRPATASYLRVLEAMAPHFPPSPAVGGALAGDLLKDLGNPRPGPDSVPDARANSPHDDLLKHLLKPYWKSDEAEWTAVLASANVDRKGRSRAMASIADWIEGSSSRRNLRVVVIESLYGSGGSVRYTRHGCYLDTTQPAQAIPALADLGLALLPAEQWQVAGKPAETLMKLGGGNAGVDRVHSACSATIITCFDGVKWQTETWFFLADPRDAQYQEVTNRRDLRPATLAYLRLLESILPAFKPGTPVGGLHAQGLLEAMAAQP